MNNFAGMKNYGILAYPAKHSLSPVMHNAAFKHLGLKAVYNLYEISPKQFGDFIESYLKNNPFKDDPSKVKESKIFGLSVSLPYKSEIMKFVTDLSEDAKKIGAVNTLIYKAENESKVGWEKNDKSSSWFGENTDWLGSNLALKTELNKNSASSKKNSHNSSDLENKKFLKGKKAVVIGAGGSARAIVYGLLKAGAKVSIVNRTLEKAEKIANDFKKIEVYKLDEIEKVNGDILIHTTSLWLHKNFSRNDLPNFCDSKFIKKFEIVMDIVYKPLITPILEIAKNLGKKIITGEKMLLYQAVKQFELWTNQKAPLKVMKNALEEKLFR